MDEAEIHNLIDLSEQMILRYHLFQYHQIHLLLPFTSVSQHVLHRLSSCLLLIRHHLLILLLVSFGFFVKNNR